MVPRERRREAVAPILAEALARARGAGPSAAAVFDLDSTLLDNRPRQARILAEYGAAAGEPRLARCRAAHWNGWDLAVPMRALGLTETEVARHVPAFRAFWAERFFTSRYCAFDEPLPGAAAFVAAVLAAGPHLAYVTGRPAAMRQGTLAALARTGFPAPDEDRVHLFMNPGVLDDAWKVAARAEVERIGRPVLAFDNEPLHVNGYASAWPSALVVHLDTDHSDRPVEVLPGIPSIPGWVDSDPYGR